MKTELTLADEHRAQGINHLHATGRKAGLPVNFGHFPKVEREGIAV